MPEAMAYMERQLPFLTNEEKRALIEHILRSMTFTVVHPEPPVRYTPSKRIGLMKGKWILPDEETDRKMDEEIAHMFMAGVTES